MESGKRKYEADVSDGAIRSEKRTKISHETVTLLHLSDDVLILILRLLSSHDLLNLSYVCERFDRIAADETLWKIVDTRDSPLKPNRFRKLLRYMGRKTRIIRIGGNVFQNKESITQSILESISRICPNLEEFILDKCYINAETITIDKFPNTIRILGITNSNVINISDQRSYFYQMDRHLPSLESIDLSNSGWLNNHSLQAIGRCDTINRCNFVGCRRIGETFEKYTIPEKIPIFDLNLATVYTALATRFGFRNATFIDLRDTFVGDSEVTCFGRLPMITHLYLGKTNPTVHIAAPTNSESNGIITDRGVMSMCLGNNDENESGKIQVLCLANTDVTNDCLRKLAGAFPLQILDVRGTQITDMGVASFKQKRPSCKVFYNENEIAE